jgi:hypothetical protein
MEQHEIDFIQKHIINFESVKIGFCRNIEFDVLQEYERIYRIYIDRQFVLTYYCNACCFDMLKRLSFYYDNLPAKQMVEQAITGDVTIDANTSIQFTETTKSNWGDATTLIGFASPADENFVFPDDLDSIQPDPSIQAEQPAPTKRKYSKRSK